MSAMIIKSREANDLKLTAYHGHFATRHSHNSHYLDITRMKHEYGMAADAAGILVQHYIYEKQIDTIVCMDGTQMIGAFLSEEIEKAGIMSINTHETTYVVAPEINNEGQMIFRDNNKGAIAGKHVVLLLATTTTGETIKRALECISYYGGEVVCVASVFSTIDNVDGVKVEKLFDKDDVINYEAYPVTDCPFCKKGHKIEAMVNGFGYSKL